MYVCLLGLGYGMTTGADTQTWSSGMSCQAGRQTGCRERIIVWVFYGSLQGTLWVQQEVQAGLHYGSSRLASWTVAVPG